MSDMASRMQLLRREGESLGDIVHAVEEKQTNQGTNAASDTQNDGASPSNESSSGSSGSSSNNIEHMSLGGGTATTTSAAATNSATVGQSGNDNGNDWVSISLEPDTGVVPVSEKTLTVSYKQTVDRGVNFKNLILFSTDGESTNSVYTGDLTNSKHNETIFGALNTSVAILNLDYFSSNTKYLGKNMRVEIDWTGDSTTGKTWSSYFAVIENESEEAAASSQVNSANAAITTQESRTPATSTSTASLGANVSSDGKKGGGGLSGGAIAGIVIGVVGGLALIAAVAFFLLRKRRKNKPTEEGFAATDSANAYMVDKETHARATDSPNSPYSDENQARSLPIDNTPHDEPPAASTAPMGGVPRASTGGSHNSRAETPQGVSTNVAHLVEEGMTVDEIRRLEEEERQLDDEIERAARR